MKHTKKKRLLAIVLCMILVLSTGIAAFANENVGLQSVVCQAATLERVMKNADGEEVSYNKCNENRNLNDIKSKENKG